VVNFAAQSEHFFGFYHERVENRQGDTLKMSQLILSQGMLKKGSSLKLMTIMMR
jgi:hypothetical protein